MKSCPACQRTFEDTLTFCLVDGSILSAPFDPRTTQEQPGARYTSPPPTEVMPPPSARRSADAMPPTIPSPPPAYGQPPQRYNAVSPAQFSYPSYGQAAPEGATPKKKRPLWALTFILLGLWLMGIFFHIGGVLVQLLLVAAAITSLISFFRLVRGKRA